MKIETISMKYPTKLWWILLCVVMIGAFAGVKELLYNV